MTNEMTQLAKDVLITALKGGSNYWYGNADNIDRDAAGDIVSIRVEDVEDGEGKKFTVTLASIEDAMLKCAEELMNRRKTGTRTLQLNDSIVKTFAVAYFDPTLDIDFDAFDADALFQLACFGEVIYG
jgi:hypothetical protein